MSDSEIEDSISSVLTQQESSQRSPSFSDSNSSQDIFSPHRRCKLSMDDTEESINDREQHDWKNLENPTTKTEILSNQHIRYRWCYNIANGRVLRCSLHDECEYRVQIVRLCKF